MGHELDVDIDLVGGMLEVIGSKEGLGTRTIRGVEHVVCSAERAVLLAAILHLDHTADAKDVITCEPDG